MNESPTHLEMLRSDWQSADDPTGLGANNILLTPS